MRSPASNHYAKAFESWLKDNFVRYIPVNQQCRVAFSQNKIKNFDFVFYPPGRSAYLAEVKGRKFVGKSFAGLSNMQNWVTADDIEGLVRWEQVFGDGQKSVLVFVYCLEKIDVESDGREIYEFCDKRYTFFVVDVEDYRKSMKPRSLKWDTVYMPADDFRRCAFSLEDLLNNG